MTDSSHKGLSADAYTELPEGKKYEPYVSCASSPSEFTAKAVLSGILFGAAITSQAPEGFGYDWDGRFAPAIAAAVFALLMLYFWRLANNKSVSN